MARTRRTRGGAQAAATTANHADADIAVAAAAATTSTAAGDAGAAAMVVAVAARDTDTEAETAASGDNENAAAGRSGRYPLRKRTADQSNRSSSDGSSIAAAAAAAGKKKKAKTSKTGDIAVPTATDGDENGGINGVNGEGEEYSNNLQTDEEGDDDDDDDDDIISVSSEFSANEFGLVKTLNDDDLEALLEAHEAAGAMKRRTFKYVPSPDMADCPLDHLPGPVVQLVFELLPSPRDIFKLCFLSRHLHSHVQHRTDLVVRAAVFESTDGSSTGSSGKGSTWSNRKTSNRIIAKLTDQVRKRAIYPPSPLRLLRLLCAQRCERGENCWDYDPEKQLSGGARQMGCQSNDRPFGLALCRKCTEDVGMTIPRFWNHWSKQEERVIVIGNSKLFHPTACSDILETSDGESVGPLITARHIQQITTSYKNDGVEKQQEVFGELVEKLYGKEGDVKYEEFETRRETFLEAYDEAQAEIEAKEQAKIARTDENRKAIIARKKEVLEPLLEILAEACEEGLPASLKEFALDYQWREGDTRDPLRFAIPFIQLKMQAFIRSTSYATQKRVDEACADIRAKLDLLDDNQSFFSYTFLNPTEEERASADRRVQRKVRLRQKIANHCQQHMPTLQDLAGRSLGYWRYPDNPFTDEFFQTLEKGPSRYETCLLRILDQRGSTIENLVKVTLVSDSSSAVTNYRRLVAACWNKLTAARSHGSSWNATEFHTYVSKCRTEYFKMKQNARDYVNKQSVRDWVSSQPANENWAGNFTRQDAVDSVWNPRPQTVRTRNHWGSVPESIQNVNTYELLRERKFNKLLEVHKFFKSQRAIS